MFHFPSPLVQETIFAILLYIILFLFVVKDQLTVFMWVYFWALYSVPLIYLSIFSPAQYCLGYYSFLVSFEVRWMGFLHGSVERIHLPVQEMQDTQAQFLGQEDSPRVGYDNPLQYSCLGNPMDRGDSGATVHDIAKESDMTWRLNNNNISGIIFLTSNSTCSFLMYSKAVDFCILTCFLQPLYHYLLVPGVYCCWFFQVFCRDNHFTYEQKQFYALLLNMDTFPPNFCCLSKNFLYDIEKEWWNMVLFLLNVHYHIFCIVFVIVLILVVLLVEVVTDFLFLGSKITVDGDCSYEIRWLCLVRKVMTNLDSVLKSRGITLLT